MLCALWSGTPQRLGDHISKVTPEAEAVLQGAAPRESAFRVGNLQLWQDLCSP